MSTIEEQIRLEKKMVSYGVNRYKYQVSRAEEQKRTADTQYAQKLFREFVIPVSEEIQRYCAEKKTGLDAKYKTILRSLDPDKTAYFGLRGIMNHFIQKSTLQKIANNIGMMIEDELRFSKFREMHGEYYDTIIADFKNKGTKSYRHMHRVLTFKANEKNVKWAEWSLKDKVAIGTKIIDCILTSTDLIEKKTVIVNNKRYIEIAPSPAVTEWIRNYHHFAELTNPDRMPCVIPPDPWISLEQGGYYTPQLRKRTQLVKTRSQEHKGMFNGDISNITRVVNAIQETPWKLNAQVHDVVKALWENAIPIGLPRSEPYVIPVSPVASKPKSKFTAKDKILFEEWKSEARIAHTMERERISKCFQVIRTLRLAAQYRDYPRFWFVYQCDFRGRIYCTTSGLSPQGPDFAKGLLMFANGVTLGPLGAHWLRVHGANTFGIDKVSYQERVKWVKDNESAILATADDPLNCTDFWGNADKPFQFLAFCFEYKRFKLEGEGMLSYLPIGVDGTCNGLQNFSAMLRDPVGGKATNLVPQNKPSDIYSEVAAVLTKKLEVQTDELGIKILNHVKSLPTKVIPRNLVKKPVMTLPYGSTQQTCTESIYAFIVDEWPENFNRGERFKVARYLTPLLWSSISEVVISARNAMDWIQRCSSIIAKENKPIIWWTPIGFPVRQDRKEILTRRVYTELAGRIKINVGEATGKMDVHKNKLGSSPNFVHSMDACHLMLTCTRAMQHGIEDFSFVHDEYSTHAANVDILQTCLREAFVQMYEENDPLWDFKVFNEDLSEITLPDPPVKGTLKLGQVLDSPYFFG